MTEQEHLPVLIAEECAEVSERLAEMSVGAARLAQRATKALRFGLAEIRPGQPLDNAERIVEEWTDLKAVVEMATEMGLLPRQDPIAEDVAIDAKVAKVNEYLGYSKSLGTVDEI